MSIEEIRTKFESDSNAQGHICYLNSVLFDLIVKKGLYGFPGAKGINLDKIGVSGWRAISSLYNIGAQIFYQINPMMLILSIMSTLPKKRLECAQPVALKQRIGSAGWPSTFNVLFPREPIWNVMVGHVQTIVTQQA